MSPLVGRLIFWKPLQYGFIEIHNRQTGELTRFFLVQRNIVKQFAEVVEVGCVVKFHIAPNFRPSRPGELPHALDAEVYWKRQATTSATGGSAQ